MARFSLAALELNRAGVTLTEIASALGKSTQLISLQLKGERRLDPSLPAVVRAIADQDTADRVLAAIPPRGAA